MHKYVVPESVRARVIRLQGKPFALDRIDAARAALVVIDMQNYYVAEGYPNESPNARAIVPNINRLSAELRRRGVPVIWVQHENRPGGSDWDGFFGAFVADRSKAAAALTAGSDMQKLWPQLETSPGNLRVAKSRYSAFIKNDFEGKLQERGIDTLLIAGTKTNVCCECTARDAMMLDYKVVMLSDCTAALSDDEHRATLENMIQQFGDVLTAEQALGLLG